MTKGPEVKTARHLQVSAAQYDHSRERQGEESERKTNISTGHLFLKTQLFKDLKTVSNMARSALV